MDATNHVYFIGIGGIGMSAIARYFRAQGKKVSGYDKTQTSLTLKLEAEGIEVFYEDEIVLIPKDIDMVIYTPAIPKDHKGFIYLSESGIPMMKRSEALGVISNSKKSIGIAGTHGKTTTSAMVCHVLKTGGLDVSAFLGGISVDYGSNFLIGSSDLVVLEADEYDRSFLRLSPLVASISSMDADHLDIYGSKEIMTDAYKAYAGKIRDNGHLLIKEGLLDQFTIKELSSLYDRDIQVLEYGYGDVQVTISNVGVQAGKYIFDYRGLGHQLKEVALNMPGKHNVENACVAITIGILNGISDESIRKALVEFKGIQRRFERIIDRQDLVYIDDYAHHPKELEMAIDAAHTLYPDKKLTGIFQPHLFTRTRDFAAEFAAALDQLDEIILMDIYPARELPIEGVTSEMIFEKMHNANKRLVVKSTLMQALEDIRPEVLMTLGAGDIDTFVQAIKNKFQ